MVAQQRLLRRQRLGRTYERCDPMVSESNKAKIQNSLLWFEEDGSTEVTE